jgi:ribonuclease HI
MEDKALKEDDTMKPKVTIYTDGSCKGNQYDFATGGYGAVVQATTGRLEFAQGYTDTTNNRMELRACIAALKALNNASAVTLITDSKYVCDAFRQNWIGNWLKNGWKKANKESVANRDLWEELLPLTKIHTITWTWVKGHAGNEGNERANVLACAATEGNLMIDRGETVVTIVN